MEGAGEKLESIMEDFLNGPNYEIDPYFVNPEDLKPPEISHPKILQAIKEHYKYNIRDYVRTYNWYRMIRNELKLLKERLYKEFREPKDIYMLPT